MNELQTALETMANNGSWKTALMYGGMALVGFMVVSALLRSGFMLLIEAIAVFYIVSIQSPDSKPDLSAAAAENVINMMVEKSTCAADSVGEIKNIGKVIRNGDVLNIAKKCGLMP
ncbi:hypothetical protein I8254_19020 [Providencia rettgeri]|uniref:hypothetical protein n=1 Tax=Providencia rettgeri TaxID=587 RepID=UPI001904D16E|nr:hypothetical protein [Providencia rettgeri]ELR5280501.1 hypothetical protein [Providencia rettgeri]MBJ9973090.1 hypothetical protein [Providencia rettgeri]